MATPETSSVERARDRGASPGGASVGRSGVRTKAKQKKKMLEARAASKPEVHNACEKLGPAETEGAPLGEKTCPCCSQNWPDTLHGKDLIEVQPALDRFQDISAELSSRADEILELVKNFPKTQAHQISKAIIVDGVNLTPERGLRPGLGATETSFELPPTGSVARAAGEVAQPFSQVRQSYALSTPTQSHFSQGLNGQHSQAATYLAGSELQQSSTSRRTLNKPLDFGWSSILGGTGLRLSSIVGLTESAASERRETVNMAASQGPLPWAIRMQQRNELFGLATIILNTLYLGVEAEVRMVAAKKFPPDNIVPRWVLWGNVVFAFLFSIELGLKIHFLRRNFFEKRRLRWNIIDALLVVIAIGEVVFEFMKVSWLRSIRVLRIIRATGAVRATRLAAHLGFVAQLRLMVASIACVIPTLTWAGLLLGILLYICALLILQGVEGSMLDLVDINSSLSGNHEQLLDNFGGLWPSILSLFMSITGGIDWGDAAQLLGKIHWAYLPFYVVFVGFVSYAVTGVLTAVIIEASSGALAFDKEVVIQQIMQEDAAKRDYLRDLFRELDKDRTGCLTREEMQIAIDKPETMALLQSIGVCVEHTHNIFESLDIDGDDRVVIEEFVEGLMRRGVMSAVLAGNDRISRKISEKLAIVEFRSGPGDLENRQRLPRHAVAPPSE